MLELMNGKITQQFEIHCWGIPVVIHSLICQGENLSINYFIPPYQLPRQRDTLTPWREKESESSFALLRCYNFTTPFLVVLSRPLALFPSTMAQPPFRVFASQKAPRSIIPILAIGDPRNCHNLNNLF